MHTELASLRRLRTLTSCGRSLDRPDSMDIALNAQPPSATAAQSAMQSHRRRQSIDPARPSRVDDSDGDNHHDHHHHDTVTTAAEHADDVDDVAAATTTVATCDRCRADLGKIINRGARCRVCELRVCKRCREFSAHSMEWLCCVCHERQM